MDDTSSSDKDTSNGHWYAKAMEQLVEVVQQLSLARDLDTVMNIVRKAARKLTEADGATFVLRDGDKCFYAEEDAIAPLWKGQRFPMSACISGWAMINRQPAVIEDIYADERIPADAYRPTFVKSLAMVPIRTIQPVGAIGTYWARQRLPSPAQIKILQALADTTAVAMENVAVYSELEARVRQRTSELQAILDHVQAGIVFSINGRIVQANPKSAEIFRLPAESMVGMMMNELLPTEVMKQADACLGEGHVFDAETRIVRNDGTEFWSRLAAKPFSSGSGTSGEIWVINDISEAKTREKTLDELRIAAEKATQFKSDFLATMSHEIRTPLSGMLGMLELLSMTPLDREQRPTLNAAWDSGRSLLRIVNDILDWSKIEEGKLALAPKPTSLSRLIRESVNTYSRIASAKGILLNEQIDPELGASYLVDPLRLSQIINNFVSNAIKFTPHGEVRVNVEFLERVINSDRIRISVRDTGVGISREAQKKLFQRFRQESADTARMYGGTGLGLAICRRLAEMMDGQISLESEPGKGSVFSIALILPISDAPGEIATTSYLEVEQRAIEPLLEPSENAPVVLAVDDHPVNRNLLVQQIRLLGLRADAAENGEKALSMWQNGNYFLVITDCHMPEMDGYELARIIREKERELSSGHVPIVAWTANALTEESDRCRRSGMDDVLVKPASMIQLKKMLAKWLQESSPIDRGVLESVIRDEDAQNRLLQDFLRHMKEDQENLSSMIKEGHLKGIEHMAHRMKGASRMVGAKYLTHACEMVELAAKHKDMEQIVTAKHEVDESISKVERMMLP